MGRGAASRLRLWQRSTRRALPALCLWLALSGLGFACEARYPAEGLPGRGTVAEFSNRTGAGRHEFWAPRSATLVMSAAFAEETGEYDHDILGPVEDAKVLTIHIRQPGSDKITCPAEAVLEKGEVFEDIAPRLADLDGDGLPEVIVVKSSVSEGASLAVYDRRARLVAATPPIGQTHRWLAPVGAADLDGDGFVEIAYIDRPHLAKTLRVWRYRDGKLTEVASATGLTNHRIGESVISGGIRNCGQGPEIVTANADWTRVMATQLSKGTLVSHDIGPFRGAASLSSALDCS